MENKFVLKDFTNEKNEDKDIEFEIQGIDNIIYFDAYDLYKRGVLKFSEFATILIRDAIVKPSEARKVSFFKNDMGSLDLVAGAIMGLQKNPAKKVARMEFSN